MFKIVDESCNEEEILPCDVLEQFTASEDQIYQILESYIK